ncbi:MAG TPA: ANTAR domain-containing protein [Pseudonocardiaceae bacterium]|nr:ANTAR domain-containing protein [Pseudonocardiaceae bacterium]
MTEATRVDRVWGVVSAHADARGVPVSLRSLCQAAAARLPISGVAVSVRGDRVVCEVLCAIGPLSRELEELQLTVGEGPSLEVLAGGRSVLVGELDCAEQQARWPLFTPAAVQAGARALFALPLRIGAIRGGVFALASNRLGQLPGEDLAEAWVFAAFALRLVLDEQAGIDSHDGHPAVDWLTGSRPEIHQATGMISVQLGVGIEEAFSRLRARAFAQGRPLSELATDVVTRRLRFDPEHTA